MVDGWRVLTGCSRNRMLKMLGAEGAVQKLHQLKKIRWRRKRHQGAFETSAGFCGQLKLLVYKLRWVARVPLMFKGHKHLLSPIRCLLDQLMDWLSQSNRWIETWWHFACGSLTFSAMLHGTYWFVRMPNCIFQIFILFCLTENGVCWRLVQRV